MRARGHRYGYSLIELLTYCVVLAVIVNLCAVLFLSARRVHALADLSAARMEALRKIEADLRSAAAASEAIATEIPGVQLPNVVLVLRTDAGDGTTRYAAWRLGDPGALIFETYELTGGNPTITAQHGYFAHVTAAAAAAMGDHGSAVRLNVSIDTEGTRNSVPGDNTFVARLRGPS